MHLSVKVLGSRPVCMASIRCSSEPLKGLHSITAILRGSVRKLGCKGAPATSSHSGSKDREEGHSALHRKAVGTQPPILLLEGGKPKLPLQDFSRFVFAMLSHVIRLYPKLPTLLYSREAPLLQCLFPLSFCFFFFVFSWKRKNCAMYVYAYTMPRRHLAVNNLCIPEVRYCLCFPCTVLLQHGADPNIRNTDGKSALDLADSSAKAVLTGKETDSPWNH